MHGAFACVICLGHTIGNFFSPCDCRGSVASIHRECLNELVRTMHSLECTVCKQTYKWTARSMKPLRKWTLPRAWTISRRCAFGDWVCFFCSLFLLGFNCVMWVMAFRSLTRSLDQLSGKIAFVLVNGLFSSLIVAVLYAPLKIVSVPIKALYYENAVFEWTPANEGADTRPQDTVMYI